MVFTQNDIDIFFLHFANNGWKVNQFINRSPEYGYQVNRDSEGKFYVVVTSEFCNVTEFAEIRFPSNAALQSALNNHA